MSASTAIATVAPAARREPITVEISKQIEDVADVWAGLERNHATLASQKLGLVRAWVESRAIQASDCIFLSITSGGRPVLMLPLMRRRALGVRMASWFTGEHLGSYAPLVDMGGWAGIAEADRAGLWRRAFNRIPDCDLVHLPDMPQSIAETLGMTAALTAKPQADCVHVARYRDWANCDAERRDKHRRKVDRQQGNKLAARGEVTFEVLGPGPEADAAIEIMFAQRAERFKVQGIRDPFRCVTIKDSYKRALGQCNGVLHVLRLDGDIVAVRYNLAAGGGLYSLITSMHPSPELQSGSPGKQNLLRVMQTVFDDGYGFIDMGKGESEEKRLWCNEAVPLLTLQHALTAGGRLAAAGLAAGEKAKGSIKRRPELFEMYRKLRSRMGQLGY